jgi:hypothetical protein
MDISINAKVNCIDGPCGESEYVVLKPAAEEITHLVVRDNLPQGSEYLVPIHHVVKSMPHHIWLNCSRKKLSKMPIFIKAAFVSTDISRYIWNRYNFWSFYAPKYPDVTLEKEPIPAGELAIWRDARVEAADGFVGRLDEFLINPRNDHITHLIIREDFLWRQKDVAIPVDRVDHYKDNTVYLKLKKRDLEKMQGTSNQPG